MLGFLSIIIEIFYNLILILNYNFFLLFRVLIVSLIEIKVLGKCTDFSANDLSEK